MVQNKTKQTQTNYTKIGIVATLVVVVAVIAGVLISGGRSTDTATALKEVSTNAVSAADLKIAVINMDKNNAHHNMVLLHSIYLFLHQQ